MEFSYSQTENFEMEKLFSDTGYFKKPVEINRGLVCFGLDFYCLCSLQKSISKLILQSNWIFQTGFFKNQIQMDRVIGNLKTTYQTPNGIQRFLLLLQFQKRISQAVSFLFKLLLVYIYWIQFWFWIGMSCLGTSIILSNNY